MTFQGASFGTKGRRPPIETLDGPMVHLQQSHALLVGGYVVSSEHFASLSYTNMQGLTSGLRQRVDHYNCLSLHVKDPKTHWT